MNPFSVFVAVVLFMIPLILLMIGLIATFTGVFTQYGGSYFKTTSDAMNILLWGLTILGIALIGVMIAYRKRT